MPPRRGRPVLGVGGVSEDTLAEDTDLALALWRSGWRVPYEDSVVAWTEVPTMKRPLWRQRTGGATARSRRWGSGSSRRDGRRPRCAGFLVRTASRLHGVRPRRTCRSTPAVDGGGYGLALHDRNAGAEVQPRRVERVHPSDDECGGRPARVELPAAHARRPAVPGHALGGGRNTGRRARSSRTEGAAKRTAVQWRDLYPEAEAGLVMLLCGIAAVCIRDQELQIPGVPFGP